MKSLYEERVVREQYTMRCTKEAGIDPKETTHKHIESSDELTCSRSRLYKRGRIVCVRSVMLNYKFLCAHLIA
jgi:hypothetical protein